MSAQIEFWIGQERGIVNADDQRGFRKSLFQGGVASDMIGVAVGVQNCSRAQALAFEELKDQIRFQTGIEHAGLDDDGLWTVRTDTGETHRYDGVIVANGHHWDPRWPEPAFPGSDTFEGVQIHAHEYTDPEIFRDKSVVVLGMGNSAMDLAVDASYVGKATYLAARRGAHIVPKYIFGKPSDQLPNDPRVPWAIRRRMLEVIIRMAVGKPEDYGLPKPDHRLADAHPTVSGRILDRIAHGTITPKPNIDRLEGGEVVFTDGSRVEADVVVYCTGYKITFPFFDEDLISAPDNRIELYRRVFHPDIPNVFFIGLLQPLGTGPLPGAGCPS